MGLTTKEILDTCKDHPTTTAYFFYKEWSGKIPIDDDNERNNLLNRTYKRLRKLEDMGKISHYIGEDGNAYWIVTE